MYARLLLASIVVAAFTLFAQPQPLGGAAPSVTRFERLRSAMLDIRAAAAERVSLRPARVDPDRMQMQLMRMDGSPAAYAAFVREVYPAKKDAIDEPDGPPEWQPMAGRWSGCWWVSLFTGRVLCGA